MRTACPSSACLRHTSPTVARSVALHKCGNVVLFWHPRSYSSALPRDNTTNTPPWTRNMLHQIAAQVLRWKVTGDKWDDTIRLAGITRVLTRVSATDAGVEESWDRQYQAAERACTTCTDCRMDRHEHCRHGSARKKSWVLLTGEASRAVAMDRSIGRRSTKEISCWHEW